MIPGYRECKRGEYWDILNSLGSLRRIGYTKETIVNFLDSEEKRARFELEQRLKAIDDLRTRLEEGEVAA